MHFISSRRLFCSLLIAILLISTCPVFGQQPDPAKIVRDAVLYWRDNSSYMQAVMTVHRPDWERVSSLRSWTKGTNHSLVRFTAPAKDAGNASLTIGDEVWSFSPKVNRVIKIPPSMMSQSWMGSDFSYDDLSKSDDIIDQYNHKFLNTEMHEGKKVYVIESIPHRTAAIVWGKEVLWIREDKLILKREFYDQDMKLYKRMIGESIKEMGGKLYTERVRMEKLEDPGEWTEVLHDKVQFGIDIPDSVFTLSNLSNPRQ